MSQVNPLSHLSLPEYKTLVVENRDQFSELANMLTARAVITLGAVSNGCDLSDLDRVMTTLATKMVRELDTEQQGWCTDVALLSNRKETKILVEIASHSVYHLV